MPGKTDASSKHQGAQLLIISLSAHRRLVIGQKNSRRGFIGGVSRRPASDIESGGADYERWRHILDDIALLRRVIHLWHRRSRQKKPMFSRYSAKAYLPTPLD